MKKFFAVLLFIWGGSALVMGISKSSDASQIGAHIGVCLVPIILGIWLWSRPKKPPEIAKIDTKPPTP